MKRHSRFAPLAVAAAVVAAVTLFVYWPVGGHPFLAWDDGVYVFENENVRGGLSAAGLRWAFTSLEQGNWHPLAWISHQVDVELFGLKAGAHHLSSLVLHVTAAILLLAVLFRSTGRLWPSAWASLLFAVHPLHVESVAWVAERKDVLAALFWMLTAAAYLRYVRRPGPGRFLLVVAVFLLGLMAKPMLVTLPLVLLLLDYWPLGRLDAAVLRAPRRLLAEKAVLLLPACAASAVAWYAQAAHAKAVVPLDLISFPQRLANAAVSAAAYLTDAVWPAGLSFFYPYPVDGHPPWMVGGAVALLAALTFGAVRERRRRPFLATGWGWYLVTLLPVIGLVQVGAQARADRYTYLPLTGVLVAAAWAGAGLAPRAARKRVVLLAAAIAVAAALSLQARRQVGFWRDAETLARRALAVTDGNWVAQVNLGSALYRQGREAEGLSHYRDAATSIPGRALRHFRRAALLLEQGDARGAAAEYLLSARLHPPYAEAWYRLGMLEAESGDPALAVEHLRAAVAYRPDFVEAHFARGVLLANRGLWEEAAAHFASALKYRPDFPEARYNLEVVLEGLGYAPGELERFVREGAWHPGGPGGGAR